MARLLDIKKVKDRIKANKAIIKTAKSNLTDAIKNASTAYTIDGAGTRKELATLIKAAQAIAADTAKLADAESEPA